MKLFVFEFSGQIDYILAKVMPEDVVWAVNSECIAMAKKKNLNILRLEEIYCHDELYAKYGERLKAVEELCSKLDGFLIEEGAFPLFKYSLYEMKIFLDQVYYYTFIINKITEKYAIKEIISEAPKSECLKKKGLFLCLDDRVSVLSILLKNRINSPIRLSYFPATALAAGVDHKISVLGSTLSRRLHIVKQVFHAMKEGAALTLTWGKKKPIILAIESKDMTEIANNFNRVKVINRLLQCIDFFIEKRSSKEKELEQFRNAIEKEGHLALFFEMNNFDIKDMLLDFSLKIYKRKAATKVVQKAISFIMRKLNVEKVVFSTLAFYGVRSFIHRWCEENDIDFYCWMHGGYGGYMSLPGYDCTDFRLCQNHIVYGKLAKLSIEQCEYLRYVNSDCSNNVFVLGSPFFYSKYRDRRSRVGSQKKKIALILSCYYDHNCYFLGCDSPYESQNYVHDIYEIIALLKQYEDEHDIVVKDYPSARFKNTIQNIFDSLLVRKIKYVSSIGYDEFIPTVDLAVQYYSTTSLVESMLVGCDVALYDPAKKVEGSGEFFESLYIYSSDINTFIGKLDKKLLLKQDRTSRKPKIKGWIEDHNVEKIKEVLTN